MVIIKFDMQYYRREESVVASGAVLFIVSRFDVNRISISYAVNGCCGGLEMEKKTHLIVIVKFILYQPPEAIVQCEY